MSSWTHEPRYQSARCLMCGCCLEVCPNFSANGTFAGAVAAVNAFRILNEEQERLEFLDKGFQGASLRNIVKEAGVTTASFYWYYSSKEELYDALVGEHYNHILQMYDDALELFWKMTKEDQKLHMGDIGGQCMVDMVEYMYSHLTAFKMLLIASAGTKLTYPIKHYPLLWVQGDHPPGAGVRGPHRPLLRRLIFILYNMTVSIYKSPPPARRRCGRRCSG